MLWRIHQIELRTGQHTSGETAANIARITALRTDMVRVKLTLTRGEDSTADVLVVPQETTFTGSHLMEHNGETWRIRAIHTGAGRTMRGTVQAPDIKRMYLHEPPKGEHFAPRTPRERRQAWKEGRLGFNPNPNDPKNTSRKASTRMPIEVVRKRRSESDHGRLVQGSKNALATWVPIVGFSLRRRMLYSYHFSPYGMYAGSVAFTQQTTAKRSSDAKEHLEFISGAFVMPGWGRIAARVIDARTHAVRRQGRGA